VIGPVSSVFFCVDLVLVRIRFLLAIIFLANQDSLPVSSFPLVRFSSVPTVLLLLDSRGSFCFESSIFVRLDSRSVPHSSVGTSVLVPLLVALIIKFRSHFTSISISRGKDSAPVDFPFPARRSSHAVSFLAQVFTAGFSPCLSHAPRFAFPT
jgi:hypothetical protein